MGFRIWLEEPQQCGPFTLQLGQRLVNGAAKKIADEFFQKFASTVGTA